MRRIVAMAVRFGAVGAFCAALNLLIMAVGLRVFGLHYVTASLWTCVITIPISYFLHRYVTFRLSRGGDLGEFVRFVLGQLLQFGIGLLLLSALVEWVGWEPLLSTFVMTGLMFIYGFLSNSTWVFRVFRSRRLPPIEAAPARTRVLQVSAFFAAHGGGIEVVAGRLAEGMAAAGVRVHWMAGGPADECPSSHSPLLTLTRARSIDLIEKRLGLPSPLWSPSSLLELWRAMRACDVLHVHDFLYMPTLTAMLFAALLGKPVVLTQHVGAIPFESRVARAVLQLLNRTLGRVVMRLVSQAVFVGRPVLNYFHGFASFRRPPLLIANGVDHSVYHPPAQHSLAMPLKLLFVGRFVEKKGLGLLRHCIDLPGVHWTFIGWGPMSPQGWSEHAAAIDVHSGLRAEELVPFFQSADLLVLPSSGEGFPLVVQEALACGTPVLVSTEVAEAFPASDPACVFEVELRTAEPVKALLSRLAALTAHAHELAEARRPAQDLARQWSWPRCVDAYHTVYDTIVTESAGR